MYYHLQFNAVLPPLLVWLALLTACASSENDAVTCSAGDVVSCSCPDGSSSTQQCLSENAPEPCRCGRGADVGDLGASDTADSSGDSTSNDGDTGSLDTTDDSTVDQSDDSTDSDSTDSDRDTTDDTSDQTISDMAVDSPDDGADGDVGLCPIQDRCTSRVLETCDPETGAFLETAVCTRSQACLGGNCIDLPDIYDSACTGAAEIEACEDAGLACGGVAAVEFCVRPDYPIAEDSECWRNNDCDVGLLCTLEGYCSQGAAGDPCREALDCAAGRVCSSETDLCVDA